VAFIAIWAITRVPGNPITGRGGPAGNLVAIIIEICQIAFVALSVAIIANEIRIRKRLAVKDAAEKPSRKIHKQTAILAGIAVAMVLIGAFVLPMVMPRGPRGGGGPPPGAPGAPSLTGQTPPTSDTQQGQQIGTLATTQKCKVTPQ
jgi:hypothetical protein